MTPATAATSPLRDQRDVGVADHARLDRFREDTPIDGERAPAGGCAPGPRLEHELPSSRIQP